MSYSYAFLLLQVGFLKVCWRRSYFYEYEYIAALAYSEVSQDRVPCFWVSLHWGSSHHMIPAATCPWDDYTLEWTQHLQWICTELFHTLQLQCFFSLQLPLMLFFYIYVSRTGTLVPSLTLGLISWLNHWRKNIIFPPSMFFLSLLRTVVLLPFKNNVNSYVKLFQFNSNILNRKCPK